MTVHPLPTRPSTQPKSATAGTGDGADAAAGDVFAALVAALLPEVAAITGGTGHGGTGTGSGDTAGGGEGTAKPGVAGAVALTGVGVDGAAPTGTGVDVDLTAPVVDAAALTASVGMPADGDSAAGADGDKAGLTAVVAATPEGPSVPILAGLTTNRPGTASKVDAAGADAAKVAADATSTTASTALLAGPKVPAIDGQPAADHSDTDDTDTSDNAPVSGAPKVADTSSARRSLPASESEPVEADDSAPITAAAPAPHQTAVHATERPSDAPPVTAAEPHQQLASVIKPLSRREDGTYHLALRLHPEHLGAVDVDVELHQGTVQVHVHTQHEETRELLMTHIDDLRRELEQAGLRAGMLDVSDRGQRQQPGLTGDTRTLRGLPASGPDAADTAASTTTTRPTTTATTDGAVDIQL